MEDFKDFMVGLAYAAFYAICYVGIVAMIVATLLVVIYLLSMLMSYTTMLWLLLYGVFLWFAKPAIIELGRSKRFKR